MRYDSRYSFRPSYAYYFPSAVKWLVIVNTALFVLYFFAVRFGFGDFFSNFALVPILVVRGFAFWQPFTYMFLHDPYGFWHILFNMLTLAMFGAELERTWGTRWFLKFYFVCGVGAALCVIVGNYLFGNPRTVTIGASGAIYGLLMAYGMLFPNRTILFSFLFPIKVKYFVMILGAIAFLSSFGAQGAVSNVAHLGGMLFGYLYLRFRDVGFDTKVLQQGYQQWRIERAKKKFKVYMKKHGSDQDPWVS